MLRPPRDTCTGLPLRRCAGVVAQARRETAANATVLYVPPLLAKAAILEALEADMELIVTITEGMPVHDMIDVRWALKSATKSRLIGPNCPGIVKPDEVGPLFPAHTQASLCAGPSACPRVPCVAHLQPTHPSPLPPRPSHLCTRACACARGQCKIGIAPGHIFQGGKIGIVSRSGTLTYEAVDQTTRNGLGQSTVVGIGGGPVQRDVVCGLPGGLPSGPGDGGDHHDWGDWRVGGGGGRRLLPRGWASGQQKPMVAFIAGQTAPPGRRMGHAGAIVARGKGAAADKVRALEQAGVTVTLSPASLGSAMATVLEAAGA